MTTYIDRYLQGEQQQVWAELLAQGSMIYQESLYKDALAVTLETMRRVRYNVELLIERLNVLGYIFGVYPEGHNKVDGYSMPFNPPAHDIANKIAKYEAFEGIGSFPLSLRIFWEEVGDIDFTGYHPAWPQYTDPLIIFPIESIEADYARWRYQLDEEGEETGLYGVPISPDYYHKANVSGGEPYRIKVPNNSIDGIVENERNQTTLVNYLRICFRFGGFPGFQWHNGATPKDISKLVDGVMQI